MLVSNFFLRSLSNAIAYTNIKINLRFAEHLFNRKPDTRLGKEKHLYNWRVVRSNLHGTYCIYIMVLPESWTKYFKLNILLFKKCTTFGFQIKAHLVYSFFPAWPSVINRKVHDFFTLSLDWLLPFMRNACPAFLRSCTFSPVTSGHAHPGAEYSMLCSP